VSVPYYHHGRFWADRFKSTLLEDDRALLDCMLYVELNAVRAGLVARPEEWKGCSLYLRETGHGDWLMPLTDLFDKTPKRALTEYRSLIYYRGEVPTKEGQAPLKTHYPRDKPGGFYLLHLSEIAHSSLRNR